MPEKRTTIILVRHGECSANIEERFRGRIDFELNELGLRQAEEIASALVRLQPAALYSSPLRRAVQRYVEDPLAELLLGGTLKPGKIKCTVAKDDKLAFKQNKE